MQEFEQQNKELNFEAMLDRFEGVSFWNSKEIWQRLEKLLENLRFLSEGK